MGSAAGSESSLACIDSSEQATSSEGRGRRGSGAVSRTEGWITFLISLSAHRAIYLLIVLQAPGNVTTTCKLVRHIVHGRKWPIWEGRAWVSHIVRSRYSPGKEGDKETMGEGKE
jgi:hypothetical protein